MVWLASVPKITAKHFSSSFGLMGSLPQGLTMGVDFLSQKHYRCTNVPRPLPRYPGLVKKDGAMNSPLMVIHPSAASKYVQGQVSPEEKDVSKLCPLPGAWAPPERLPGCQVSAMRLARELLRPVPGCTGPVRMGRRGLLFLI